jgi:hypothetical protein
VWKYIEKMYSNKLENSEEINKPLDAFHQPKLNQEYINHLNRSVKGINSSFPTKYSTEFTAKSYQTFKEELVPILLKLFHELEKGRNTIKLILCSEYYIHSNPDKNTQKREL